MTHFITRTALLAAVALSPLLAQAGDAGPLIPTQQPEPEINTVPEPGSLALAMMAIGASLALRRRRKGGSDAA